GEMEPLRSSSAPAEAWSLDIPHEIGLAVDAMVESLSTVSSLDQDDTLAKFLVAESLTTGFREAVDQRKCSLSYRTVSNVVAENSSFPIKEYEQVVNDGDIESASALGNDKTIVSTKLSSFLVQISELFTNLVYVGKEERGRNFGDSTDSPKIILDFEIDKLWLIHTKPEIKS
ncbi:unnamed protein product, partial [Meganyctiphanes norvegica]